MESRYSVLPSTNHARSSLLLIALVACAIAVTGCERSEDVPDSAVQPVAIGTQPSLSPGGLTQPREDLAEAGGTADVRIAYRLTPETGWSQFDQLELAIDRIEVDFIPTEQGCDDRVYLDHLVKSVPSKAEPLDPGSVRPPGQPQPLPSADEAIRVYYSDVTGRTLDLGLGTANKRLRLPELNHLPTGFIVGLRIFIAEAELVQGATRTPVTVPEIFGKDQQGLQLAADEGRVPVCRNDVAAIRLDLSAKEWLSGSLTSPTLLKGVAAHTATAPHILGTTTAPIALLAEAPARLEVPSRFRSHASELWVEFPERSVSKPVVIRVRQMDLGDARERTKVQHPDPLYDAAEDKGSHLSVDPVFRNLMARVGIAYDLRPDGLRFARPITIGMPAPMPQVPPDVIDELKRLDPGVPKLDVCLVKLNARGLESVAALQEQIHTCIVDLVPEGHPLFGDLLKTLPDEVEGFDADSLDLFTWSPAYRLWLPDVPRLTSAHRDLRDAELDRVDTLLDDAAPGVEIEPDFSAIPAERYGDLRIDRINNRIEQGYLVTASNHFCTKSLFTDLNVGYRFDATRIEWVPISWYEPLVDGALDDMCQTTDGFGFVRDSNEEVHCGGDPFDSATTRSAANKTGRIIREGGVDLRFKSNVREFFDDEYADPSLAACPAPGSTSATYCYDLDDFRDDVLWAVRVWQEAINRDPDGGWTDRFTLECITTEGADPETEGSNCGGREFDVGIKALDDAWGQTSGRNFVIDDDLVRLAIAGRQGRARLRSTIVHELGHAIGLDHWAGAGTLMSYNGRSRRNDYRFNICSPFSAAEVGGTPPPYPDAESDRGCYDAETLDRFGNAYEWDTATPPNKDWHSARINRLTCTDVQRIRRQVNEAEIDWAANDPIRCELLTEKTEYAVVERKVYDDSDDPADPYDDCDPADPTKPCDLTNPEVYSRMELALRFPHCEELSGRPAFSRMELELLGVNPDNNSDMVANLYRPDPDTQVVLSIDLEPPVNGFYDVPLSLESRRLLERTIGINALLAVPESPSFKEYMGGQHTLPGATTWPNLALALRTYVETVGSDGVRDEYVAGSTGLIRTPIFTPIDAPITLSLEDIRFDGVSIADEAYFTQYDDIASSADLFPHIDDARKKPSVGKALYVNMPPSPPEAGIRIAPTMRWRVEFDHPLRNSVGDSELLWVHSIEVNREEVPTVEDRGTGTTRVVSPPPRLLVEYTGDPGIPQDPCQHVSQPFDIYGFELPDEPMYDVAAGFSVWNLFHVNLKYKYVPVTGCTGDVCTPAGVLGAGCTLGTALGWDHEQDYYLSFTEPTGAITKPSAERHCVFHADGNDPNYYAIEANARSLKGLARDFPRYAFQARIGAVGTIAVSEVGRPHHTPDGPWIDASDLPADGLLTDARTVWFENRNGTDDDGQPHAYKVSLRYRYCHPPDATTDMSTYCADDSPNWTEPVTLDSMRLTFESRNDAIDCPGGYERERYREPG